MGPNPQEIVDWVTFTKEILNGKLHFWCCEFWSYAAFWLIFWHKKQAFRCGAFIPGMCFDIYVRLYKTVLFKNEKILSYMGLKNSYLKW